MKEEWKTIEDFPDYAVSNTGNVKRITNGRNTFAGRILKQSTNGSGYLYVGLTRNGRVHTKRVAFLVAHSFIGKRPKDHQINHIDGCKTNNRSHNLEYVTAQENIRHSFRLGLSAAPKGEKQHCAKLDADKVRMIRQGVVDGISLTSFAKQYRVTPTAIYYIVIRRTWKHIQ